MPSLAFHADAELKPNAQAAAASLRRAMQLQLSARVESEERQRAEVRQPRATCTHRNPKERCPHRPPPSPNEALARDTDGDRSYVALLRQLCRSAAGRQTACGDPALEAHFAALAAHLRLAEELLAEPIEESATGDGGFAKARASAARGVSRGEALAFGQVGLARCLIANLDAADAATLWDCLRLGDLPPTATALALADGGLRTAAFGGAAPASRWHSAARVGIWSLARVRLSPRSPGPAYRPPVLRHLARPARAPERERAGWAAGHHRWRRRRRQRRRREPRRERRQKRRRWKRRREPRHEQGRRERRRERRRKRWRRRK